MTNLSQINAVGPGFDMCLSGNVCLFPFTMAFQPIVDAVSETVFAYESLVRGPNGESAASILDQITDDNRYAFDQSCRVKAIELASRFDVAGHGAKLSVNFMPNTTHSPQVCIQKTLQAAHASGFPLDSLIFEITEEEKIYNSDRMRGIVVEYQKHGLTLALDDFGAGYSGLNSLSNMNIDIVKLDVQLIRNIHKNPRAQTIVRSTVEMCHRLGVQVIGEAVETIDEYEVMLDCGIRLMQGFLFARPQLESLPQINWPKAAWLKAA